MKRNRFFHVLVVFLGMSLLTVPGTIWGETVKFQFSYLPQGKKAPFYSAAELGYFREAGLTVEMHRGFGSADTIKKVAGGVADYGAADAGSLVAARAQGLRVKEVAMLHAKSLSGIFFLNTSGIRTPKDLEGKTLGDVAGGAVLATFPAFASANGVDADKVKIVTMAASAKLPSLISGKVDSIATYALALPALRRIGKKAGKEVVAMMYSDYGVDTYSNGLVLTDERIANNPDQVRKFVHASMKGVLWSLKNPEKAMDHFIKHNPGANRAFHRAIFNIFVDHLLTEETDKMGLGYMSQEKMKFTRDVMVKALNLSKMIPVEELYTNEFLPKLYFKRSDLTWNPKQ